MKKLYKLAFLTVVGLGLSVFSSFGQVTFDFSYTFGDDNTVSGQLDGTYAGRGIVDVTSLLSLYYDGVLDTTTPYGTCSVVPFCGSQAMVSFNADENDFFFGDADANGFGMTPFYSSVGAVAYTTVGDFDDPTICANWSLTAVPEPTTIIAGASMLLPFGVSALRMLRKNKKA